MPSPAQIRANRANAQMSTGPKTEAGKARASQNARTHGLTAARVVIQGDFSDEYQEIIDHFAATYQPYDYQEEVLVQQIADAWHRIGRCREIETSTIDLGTTQFFCQHQFEETHATHNPHNERLALGYAFEHKGDQLCRLRRYETAIERSYYRAIQQLTRIQTLRKKEENRTGSVSQKYQPASVVEPLTRGAGSASLASAPKPALEPLPSPATASTQPSAVLWAALSPLEPLLSDPCTKDNRLLAA